MKNEKDIGASAELNMPDDKPLVLKPEWESKPKKSGEGTHVLRHLRWER